MPSTLEWVAVALGIINIALLIRRNIWNYPFGMAMVALYFLIFRDARLYSDMLLQLFFFAVQALGWWAWVRAGGLDGPVEAQRMAGRQRLFWLLATGVATGLWGWAMQHYTNAAAPWWDAAVAMGSVAAQIMLVRRYFENWFVWILVDMLAIGLYWSRDLHLTAGLYALFLVMCLLGLREWLRAERDTSPALPGVA